uniref:Uncharacterized protein n=1 Tax=Anguilla anguilla TaxID=7936 RepID=A0A0E9S3S0_ANGAN
MAWGGLGSCTSDPLQRGCAGPETQPEISLRPRLFRRRIHGDRSQWEKL